MYIVKLISGILAILLLSSCNMIQNNEGVITEFVIKIPQEPNCPSLGFKITSNKLSFRKIMNSANNYKIEIKGAFFSDSLFSMVDPILKSYKIDTLVITSRSCYFNNTTQHELDSIASITLKNISIVFSGHKTKWVFKSKV